MDEPRWERLDWRTRWGAMAGFTRRTIPELRGLPAGRGREPYKAAMLRAWRTGRTPWLLGVYLAAQFALGLAWRPLPREIKWWALIPFGVIWAVLWLVLNGLMFQVLRRCVRAELGTHCAGCDYDLRQSEERCPECGRVVEEESSPVSELAGGGVGESRDADER